MQPSMRSGQSSSGDSGILNSLPGSGMPWLNQSCASNWIQAAANRFSVVAGMNVRRARSSREMSRGLGSSSSGSGSGTASVSGMFRPKRAHVIPIRG